MDQPKISTQIKNNPGQKSSDPKINKFDNKEYTLAANSEVNYYNKEEREQYHINAEIEWKSLCYTQKNGECCYLLGEFYKTPWASGPIGKYSPQNSFKTYTDACANLNWASCCNQAAQGFLYNSGLTRNFFTGKQNFLYAFEHLRRACLLQDYNTVGGERPTDFKAMEEAGKACATLFEIVEKFRTQNEFTLTVPPETFHYKKEDFLKQLDEESRTENLIQNCKVKPDHQEILNLFQKTPLSTIMTQGCKFKNKDLCFQLFKARMNGLYGFQKDIEEAYKVGEQACRSNHPKACFNLYKMYDKGIGRVPDPKQAEIWKNWYYEISGLKQRNERFKSGGNKEIGFRDATEKAQSGGSLGKNIPIEEMRVK